MKAEYLKKHINEYGQINIYTALLEIHDKVNFRLYRIADKMINELYEIYAGARFENINPDLVVFTFDEECEMFLLLNKISDKLYSKKGGCRK